LGAVPVPLSVLARKMFVSPKPGSDPTVLLDNVYRDASGQTVFIGEFLRIAFSWDRNTARRLELIDFDDGAFCTLASRSNDIAVSAGTQIQQARLTASSGNTGTYTIIVYGV
jgi:hypothetical protein